MKRHGEFYRDFTIVYVDGAYFVHDEEINRVLKDYPTIEEAKEAIDAYIENRDERNWYRSQQDGTSQAERSEQQYRNQKLK